FRPGSSHRPWWFLSLIAQRAANLPADTSWLAGRAIEGGAAGLDDARHRAAAASPRARMPLAVVDAERMLEIAERAVGADMVAQRRAAGFDRLRDHLADGLRQRRAQHGIGGDLAGSARR